VAVAHPYSQKNATSDVPTPLHLISRIPVAKIEIKREMNQILAKLLICIPR